MRSVLNGKGFIAVMMVALTIALFMPEIWVLCAVNSNIVLDVTLTIVFVMFVFEFVALSALDATYFLSFFFLMDMIGTLSMIFDISYMVGMDNTEVTTYTAGDTDASKNLMLLRAARAARVGARAGRLSKIVRFLRFLPFLSAGMDDQSGGMAASVSRQLANLMGTRVACLTIVLVTAIPAFDILTFPQNDLSLQAWVERLSANLDEDTALGTSLFHDEMTGMISFFEKYSYGPYIACRGKPEGSNYFQCLESVNGSFTFSAPNRPASALWVHTDTFMVGFNMHQTEMVDKGLAMVNISFIICIMVFSGLALTNVITQLAVRPLERMLKTVRDIANQVFQMSSGLVEEAEDEGEEFDINTSTEMKLLEKVVNKLAIIADLQAGQDAPLMNEEMGAEDIGVINLMQGTDVVREGRNQASRRVSRVNKQAKGKGSNVGRRLIDLEEVKVPLATYESYGFNTLVLNKQQMTAVGVHAISRFHDEGEGFINTEEDMVRLRNFVVATEKQYLSNQFHNFSHAIDVLHGVARIMRLMQSEDFLTELEQFSVLIASIGHDLGHPGVNNVFLSETGHELAIQYNDLSPLENMHVSKLYGILQNPETNVLETMTKEQYKEVRKYCIETILHTDMMLHQAMIKELTLLFEMNKEIFSSPCNNGATTEIFSQADTKILLMDNILHSADVSNPCRVWQVSHDWAHRVLEEFFSQGEQEKELGVPVGFLNDREKLNRPNSQIGFLEFMIAPFFAAQIRLFHSLHEYGDHLGRNIASWEEMWEQEVHPDEESCRKGRDRVEKVRATLDEASQVGASRNNTAVIPPSPAHSSIRASKRDSSP